MDEETLKIVKPLINEIYDKLSRFDTLDTTPAKIEISFGSELIKCLGRYRLDHLFKIKKVRDIPVEFVERKVCWRFRVGIKVTSCTGPLYVYHTYSNIFWEEFNG